MNDGLSENFLVLSIYPSSRGFAFVLFDGPASPFDWGIKAINQKRKDEKVFEEIKKIVERYRPEVLVMEETSGQRYQRAQWIKRLYRRLLRLANDEYMLVYRYGKDRVKDCFSDSAENKQQIAEAVITEIPAFQRYRPRVRKAWTSEDCRMSLFDAAALGLTYYGSDGQVRTE